jgi:hypothetical protein
MGVDTFSYKIHFRYDGDAPSDLLGCNNKHVLNVNSEEFKLLFLLSSYLPPTPPSLSAPLCCNCHRDVELGVAGQTYVGEENER